MTKEKEWNLSEEREDIVQFAELDNVRWEELMSVIRSQDKEFIRRENDLMRMFWDGKITWVEYKKRRKELIGEELSK